MGSFNATCVISGLQIEANDPVRFLALTESRYHRGNEHSCYVTGRWQLRTPPLRAQYNDYGSVEQIQPGLVEQVFFKSFDSDVIEKGVGDNQCHDVQVRKGMGQDEWLTALWEGRVFVDDDDLMRNPNYVHVDKDEYHKKGVPTLARIEKVLKDADLPVVTEYGAKGFVIDGVIEGFVRVRNGRFEEDQKLTALEKAVKVIHAAGYAAMITCGTGNYANNAEILVAPRPGIVDANGSKFQLSVSGLNPKEWQKKERAVSQAMIREDVWQILLATPVRGYTGAITHTVDSFKRLGRLAIKQDRDFKKTLESLDDVERVRRECEHLMDLLTSDNLLLQSLRGSEGVSGFSLKNAYDLAIKMATSDKKLFAFMDDLAETVHVQHIYANLHGQWHPSTNSGQDPEWEGHAAFHKALVKICDREIATYRDDEG